MKRITSRQNEDVKKIRYLQTKKGRDEFSLFVIEGEKSAAEAISAGLAVFVACSESYMKGINRYAICPDTVFADEIFEYVCDTVAPQGVLALVKKTQAEPVETGFEIYAEDIKDPGNLGTIIRTAESFGACAVNISRGSADPYSPKTVRATMGSILRVSISIHDDTQSFLRQKKEEGYNIIAGHLKGDEISRCLETQYKKVMLVIGSESAGISDETADICDSLVRIPIYGKNESLNAAVAAGIFMYEISKRLTSLRR